MPGVNFGGRIVEFSYESRFTHIMLIMNRLNVVGADKVSENFTVAKVASSKRCVLQKLIRFIICLLQVVYIYDKNDV